MRTVHCSSHLGGGVSAQGVSAWRGEGCLPDREERVCLPGSGVSPHGGVYLPPVDRILGIRLWKHYLSATLFADGNRGREQDLDASFNSVLNGFFHVKGKSVLFCEIANCLRYFRAGSSVAKGCFDVCEIFRFFFHKGKSDWRTD